LVWNQDNVSEWGPHVYPQTVVSVSYHYDNPHQLHFIEN